MNLITTPEIAQRLRSVFQETLLGPATYDRLEEEFLGEESLHSMPDLQQESAYFARNPFHPDERIDVDTILNV